MANQRPLSRSSTTSNNQVSAKHPRRSVLARFSTLSVASALPQYSMIDHSTMEDPPPAFEDSLLRVSSQHFVHDSSCPRFSTILSAAPLRPVIDPHTQNRIYDFQQSFPINPEAPWATLQLHTRDSSLGRPHPNTGKSRIPRIWGSDPIVGAIVLDLENSLMIQEIRIQIKGKIITSSLAEGSHTFLNYEQLVWNKAMGEPRNLSSTSSEGQFDGKFRGPYSIPFSFPFPTHVDLSTKTAVRVHPHQTTLAQENDAEASGEAQSGVSSSFASSPVDSAPTILGQSKKRGRSWSLFSSRKLSHATSASSPESIQDLTSGSGVLLSQSAAMTNDPDSNEHSGVSIFPIPQSFSDKVVTLCYELSAIFVHGRFRPDNRIRTNVAYLPVIEPLPMSARRRQAYEEGTLLPAPTSDPDGWFKSPAVSVRGVFNEILGLFGKREVVVECVLYLANPLAYTRGTIIPCYISLSCIDPQALRELDNPNAPTVRLVRRMRHLRLTQDAKDTTTDFYELTDHHDEQREKDLSTLASFGLGPHSVRPLRPPSSSKGDLDKHNVVIDEVAHAVWWTPPKDVAQEPTMKWLEGEIHLEPGLQPSCTCPIFSVEYVVEMLAPKSTYIETYSDPTRSSSLLASGKGRASHEAAIFAQLVEITTLHRSDEPVPVAFSEAPKSRHCVSNINPLMEQPED